MPAADYDQIARAFKGYPPQDVFNRQRLADLGRPGGQFYQAWVPPEPSPARKLIEAVGTAVEAGRAAVPEAACGK